MDCKSFARRAKDLQIQWVGCWAKDLQIQYGCVGKGFAWRNLTPSYLDDMYSV